MSTQPNLDQLLNAYLSEGPQAALEKRFIIEYLHDKGYRWEELADLPKARVKEIMTAACRHASLKLAEVESRRQFTEEIKLRD